MGGWVLVSEKRKTLEEIKNVNYHELTTEERLDVLMAVLDSEHYEVYQRGNGDICAYNLTYEEFYTENSNGTNNLILFWSEVVKAIHSELIEEQRSKYKIQQLEAG
jgi:DNA-directed RNA polymerase beta' subunit